MSRYAIYEPTGRIVSIVQCLESELALYTTGDLQSLVCPEGIDDSTHYVDDGDFVAFPAKPGAHFTWNWATLAWEDQRTLAQVKDAKRAEMLAARNAEEFGNFTWDGSVFLGDELSQRRMQGGALMGMLNEQDRQNRIIAVINAEKALAADPDNETLQDELADAVAHRDAWTFYQVDWTLADDTVRTMKGSYLIQAGIAMSAQVAGAHAKWRTVRESIDAAATIAAVEAITWPT